ncbi:MAG: hypothetical protein BWY77_00759 [bacterium ADurb.Bin431]|nr:MAG: hypothetical protein BWY77_00759 [bacterium ADurb.Bin431]HNY91276.1 hypothetical protein [bacterium]HOH05942.1 hypothetical protein [bacterium]
MKFYRLTTLFLLAAVLAFCGCYTTIRLPRASAEEEEYVEEWRRMPLNPSIPASHAGDFDWLFYYQLPWWLDAAEVYYDQSPGQSWAPEEFRQRYPQSPDYSGSFSGSYSPTVTSPGLGKQAADSSTSSGASEQKDSRRSFNQNAGSSPAAGTSESSKESGSDRRDSKPSSSGTEKPKRR